MDRNIIFLYFSQEKMQIIYTSIVEHRNCSRNLVSPGQLILLVKAIVFFYIFTGHWWNLQLALTEPLGSTKLRLKITDLQQAV